MRDDALDALVVVVGRGLGLGEHVLRVEDVEPLVLHRAHVEVVDGDDHVDVEVVLETERLLVPLHRALQRRSACSQLSMFCGSTQISSATSRPDSVVKLPRGSEVARDEREEIAGLREGILPSNPSGARRELALADAVAVREQHGIARAIGLDRVVIARHHVGPVQEVGDSAKAHRPRTACRNCRCS